MRKVTSGPPFPPDHRQAGERGAIILDIILTFSEPVSLHSSSPADYTVKGTYTPALTKLAARPKKPAQKSR